MIDEKRIFGQSQKMAVEFHKGQMYGRKPYNTHLFDVVGVLKRFVEWDTLSQELIDAAWLHDVVEDTETTADYLEHVFGKRVRDLVSAVTNEPGENRKIRGQLTYPKIRETSKAILIKLSDRIANVEQCISHDRLGRKPGKLFKMYLKEWPDFQEGLRGRCAGEDAHAKIMWEHLDGLFIEGQFNTVRVTN